jgi:hypothetical protein
MVPHQLITQSKRQQRLNKFWVYIYIITCKVELLLFTNSYADREKQYFQRADSRFAYLRKWLQTLLSVCAICELFRHHLPGIASGWFYSII